MTRREWVRLAGSGGTALALGAAGPAAAVAIGRCPDYSAGVAGVLARMFDQLGGLGRLVRGKTVAIKLNLGGRPTDRLGYRPHELSNWVHPRVIGSLLHLMDAAGARRIRLLEGARYLSDPLEEHLLTAGWDPNEFVRAAARVELRNTNTRGHAREYARVAPGPSSHIYPSFLLNPAYIDCDVFVSLAKMKEHQTTGITLSMKNCFGITPTAIYGDDAGVSEPNENPKAGRGEVFHRGSRQPSKAAAGEQDPGSPRDPGYRVPRIIADIAAARPVDLAIIDGIHSIAGGEGVHGRGVRPAHAGVLIAGTNCVNTDAVGAAVMGFDPSAERGTPPFERCDSTLRMAAALGLGTFDLSRIEVRGAPIQDVRYPFRAIPRS